jgi:SAM-dependent methyltransferase
VDAKEWDERYRARELVWGVEPNRFVAAELADASAGRALDLACGEGRNAIWLAQRGWKVAAADFSQVAIEKGQQLAAHAGVAVDWHVADVSEWAAEPRAFDLVLWCYLQVGGKEREGAFRNALRAVAPGGTFLFVAHDLRNLTDGYGGPSDPSVLYTIDDVVARLDGFTVGKAGEVFRPMLRDDGTPAEGIDCLVRAVRQS